MQGSRGMMGMRGFNGARGERVGLENLSLFFCENVNSLCEMYFKVTNGIFVVWLHICEQYFRSDLISRYYL